MCKLFSRTKSPNVDMDSTQSAEAMYRRIASDLGLEIIKKEHDPVELSMNFPKQKGLRTSVWVCLQNVDELWFVIDGFTCSMFPYEEVKEEFENQLRQALTGQSRVRKYVRRRDGAVFKALLQQNIGGKWVTTYPYGKIISLFPTFAYEIVDEFIAEHDPSNDDMDMISS